MNKNLSPNPTAVELTAEILESNKGPKRVIDLSKVATTATKKKSGKRLKSLGVSHEGLALNFIPKTLKGRRVVLTEDSNGPLGVTGDSEIMRRNIASFASYKRFYDSKVLPLSVASFEAFEFFDRGIRKQEVDILALEPGSVFTDFAFHQEDKNHVKLFYFSSLTGEKSLKIFPAVKDFGSAKEAVSSMQEFLGNLKLPYQIEKSIKSHFNGADRFSGLSNRQSKQLKAAVAAFKS
jgi:hypothetical protein